MKSDERISKSLSYGCELSLATNDDSGCISSSGAADPRLFVREGKHPDDFLGFEGCVFALCPPVLSEDGPSTIPSSKAEGLPLTYGSRFSLRHAYSGMFVALLASQPATLDCSCHTLMLVDGEHATSATCDFKIVPKYKMHSEGDYVCHNDEVHVQLYEKNLFFHTSEAGQPVTDLTRRSSVVDSTTVEVNGAESATALAVRRYDTGCDSAEFLRETTRKDKEGVLLGHPIVVIHRELEAMLINSHSKLKATLSSYAQRPMHSTLGTDGKLMGTARRLRGQSTIMNSTVGDMLGGTLRSSSPSEAFRPIFLHYGNLGDEDRITSNDLPASCSALWCFENANPMVGGPAQYYQEYRIRQASTNLYLCVEGNATDDPSATDGGGNNFVRNAVGPRFTLLSPPLDNEQLQKTLFMIVPFFDGASSVFLTHQDYFRVQHVHTQLFLKTEGLETIDSSGNTLGATTTVRSSPAGVPTSRKFELHLNQRPALHDALVAGKVDPKMQSTVLLLFHNGEFLRRYVDKFESFEAGDVFDMEHFMIEVECATEALGSLITFCSVSNTSNPLSREGLPCVENQHMLFELQLHRLVFATLLCPFVGEGASKCYLNGELPPLPLTGGVIKLQDLHGEKTVQIHRVCQLAFHLLKLMVRGRPQFGEFVLEFIHYIYEYDGFELGVESCLAEIFKNGCPVPRAIGESTGQYCIEALTTRKFSPGYLKILSALCTDSATYQNLICERLVSAHPEVFLGCSHVNAPSSDDGLVIVRLRESDIPTLLVSDADASTRDSNEDDSQLELYEFLQSYGDRNKVRFFIAQIEFFAALCSESLESCCNAVEGLFPKRCMLTVLRTFFGNGNPGLPRSSSLDDDALGTAFTSTMALPSVSSNNFDVGVFSAKESKAAFERCKSHLLDLAMNAFVVPGVSDPRRLIVRNTVLLPSSFQDSTPATATVDEACKELLHHAKRVASDLLINNPKQVIDCVDKNILLTCAVRCLHRFAALWTLNLAEMKEVLPSLLQLLSGRNDRPTERKVRIEIHWDRHTKTEENLYAFETKERICKLLSLMVEHGCKEAADRIVQKCYAFLSSSASREEDTTEHIMDFYEQETRTCSDAFCPSELVECIIDATKYNDDTLVCEALGLLNKVCYLRRTIARYVASVPLTPDRKRSQFFEEIFNIAVDIHQLVSGDVSGETLTESVDILLQTVCRIGAAQPSAGAPNRDENSVGSVSPRLQATPPATRSRNESVLSNDSLMGGASNSYTPSLKALAMQPSMMSDDLASSTSAAFVASPSEGALQPCSTLSPQPKAPPAAGPATKGRSMWNTCRAALRLIGVSKQVQKRRNNYLESFDIPADTMKRLEAAKHWGIHQLLLSALSRIRVKHPAFPLIMEFFYYFTLVPQNTECLLPHIPMFVQALAFEPTQAYAIHTLISILSFSGGNTGCILERSLLKKLVEVIKVEKVANEGDPDATFVRLVNRAVIGHRMLPQNQRLLLDLLIREGIFSDISKASPRWTSGNLVFNSALVMLMCNCCVANPATRHMARQVLKSSALLRVLMQTPALPRPHQLPYFRALATIYFVSDDDSKQEQNRLRTLWMGREEFWTLINFFVLPALDEGIAQLCELITASADDHRQLKKKFLLLRDYLLDGICGTLVAFLTDCFCPFIASRSERICAMLSQLVNRCVEFATHCATELAYKDIARHHWVTLQRLLWLIHHNLTFLGEDDGADPDLFNSNLQNALNQLHSRVEELVCDDSSFGLPSPSRLVQQGSFVEKTAVEEPSTGSDASPSKNSDTTNHIEALLEDAPAPASPKQPTGKKDFEALTITNYVSTLEGFFGKCARGYDSDPVLRQGNEGDPAALLVLRILQPGAAGCGHFLSKLQHHLQLMHLDAHDTAGLLTVLRAVVVEGTSVGDQRNNNSKEVLVKTQNLLNEHNIMMVVMTLLDVGDESILLAALDLGIAMLEGGNKTVQDGMLHFFETHDERFFHNLRDMIHNALALAKQNNHQRQQHQVTIKGSQLVVLGMKNAGDSTAAAGGKGGGALILQQDKYIEKVLRLLQLMCEGHHLGMQNYIRVQRDNLHSINMVQEVLQLMKHLCVNIDPWSTPVIMRGFALFTEFCQGPCPQNQFALLNGDVCSLICKVLHCLTPECDESVTTLVNHASNTLLALLEGCNDSKFYGKIVAQVSPSLVHSVMKTLESVLAEHHGLTVPASDDSASRRVFAKRLLDLLQSEESDDNRVDTLFNLVIYFRQVSPFASRFEVLRAIRKVLHEFEYLSPFLGCIEIQRDDHLEKVFFRIPFICSSLTTRSKDELLWSVDRTSRSTKLVDFFHKSDELIFGMEIAHEFRKKIVSLTRFPLPTGDKAEGLTTCSSPRSAKQQESSTKIQFAKLLWNNLLAPILVQQRIGFYENASLVNACAITLTMLRYSSDHAQCFIGSFFQPFAFLISPQATCGLFIVTLQLLQLIIHVVTFWMDSAVYLPVYVYSLERKFHRRQLQQERFVEDEKSDALVGTGTTAESLGMNEPTMATSAEPPKFRTRAAWRRFPTLYYASHVAIALLSLLINPHFSALHLMGFVYQSTMLCNVIFAVTQNGKSLLLTMGLGAMIIYLFSILGFEYFPHEFDPTGSSSTHSELAANLQVSATENTFRELQPRNEHCQSLFQCYVHILVNGIRHGGGVGEMMAEPEWNDIGRIAFNFLFFALINVVFLNILFGIIIDSFADLRDEKKKKETDMHTCCFVCGVDCDTFDAHSSRGFQHHVQHEHNMWQYLYFMHYLKRKDEDEYTGQESYVACRMKRNNLSFFPQGMALSIASESDGKLMQNESGGGGTEDSSMQVEGATQAAQQQQLALSNQLRALQGDTAQVRSSLSEVEGVAQKLMSKLEAAQALAASTSGSAQYGRPRHSSMAQRGMGMGDDNRTIGNISFAGDNTMNTMLMTQDAEIVSMLRQEVSSLRSKLETERAEKSKVQQEMVILQQEFISVRNENEELSADLKQCMEDYEAEIEELSKKLEAATGKSSRNLLQSPSSRRKRSALSLSSRSKGGGSLSPKDDDLLAHSPMAYNDTLQIGADNNSVVSLPSDIDFSRKRTGMGESPEKTLLNGNGPGSAVTTPKATSAAVLQCYTMSELGEWVTQWAKDKATLDYLRNLCGEEAYEAAVKAVEMEERNNTLFDRADGAT